MKLGISVAISIFCVVCTFSTINCLYPFYHEKTRINLFDYYFHSEIASLQLNDNLAFSPLSTHFLLTVLSLGASGQTLQELDENLYLLRHSNDMVSFYEKNLLERINNLKNAIIRFANRIYLHKTVRNFKGFTSTLKSVPPSIFYTLDSNPSQAIVNVNKWIRNATEGKILEIVRDTDIDSSTRMVLLNTIYLSASWKTAFNKQLTRNKVFYINKRTQKTVPMMTTTGYFIYEKLKSLNDSHYIELPFKEKKLKMTILVPNKNVLSDPSISIDQFHKHIIQKSSNPLQEEKISFVQLCLPKFEIESEFDLKPILQNLGIKSVFSNGASLFNSTYNRDKIKLDKIKQKLLINVNEDGIEAPAAASGGITPKPGGSIQLNVDSPFYYSIQYDGFILFEGQVIDPQIS